MSFRCITFIHQTSDDHVDTEMVGPLCILLVIHVYFFMFITSQSWHYMHLGYINNLFILNKKQASLHYSLIKTSASLAVDSRDVLLCGDKWEVMKSFASLI